MAGAGRAENPDWPVYRVKAAGSDVAAEFAVLAGWLEAVGAAARGWLERHPWECECEFCTYLVHASKYYLHLILEEAGLAARWAGERMRMESLAPSGRKEAAAGRRLGLPAPPGAWEAWASYRAYKAATERRGEAAAQASFRLPLVGVVDCRTPAEKAAGR